MPDYYKQGSFIGAGGGKAGAIIDLWALSRFGGTFPTEGQAPPAGSPDAGPVVTGATEGNPGGYLIQNIPVVQDYCLRAQYGGTSYWGGCPAGSIGGQGSGGGGGGGTPFIIEQVIYGPTTTVGVNPGLTPAALDSTNLTVTIVVPASAAVRVTVSISGSVADTTEGLTMWLAMATHGTTTLVTPRETVIGSQTGSDLSLFNVGRVTYDSGLITGLTPGATLQWDVIAAASAAGGAGAFEWDDGLTGSNTNGPVLITVYDSAGTGGGGGAGGAVSSVSNEDGTLTISPITGGVVASLTNPISVPVVVAPTTNEVALTTKAIVGQTANQYELYDSSDNLRSRFGPDGGIAVADDVIQVSYGLFTGSPIYLTMDPTTNPPSLLWPNSARYWVTTGLPTSNTQGVLLGTANVGDKCYVKSTQTEYVCLGAGTPGYNGTWAVSNAMVPANGQTANYTLALTDVGGVVEMNSASALNITFPPGVFGATMTGEIYQEGAGAVTCVAGAGVTVRSPNGLVFAAQYATISYRWRSATEVVLSGDLT